jgi:hypothetical protein
MKEVPLTNGGITLIDDADYEQVSRLRWGKKRTPAGYWYARSTTNPRIWLHRLITGAPADLDVDHRDHDTLNNQRDNLQVATRSQNQHNRKGARVDSLTGVRGVTYISKRYASPWRAYAQFDGVKYYFGHHKTKAEAEHAAIEGRKALELLKRKPE